MSGSPEVGCAWASAGRAGRGLGGDAGSVSLELVLLVPVLVLLTLFVLWAGRGGRAGLTADLAAEEAATAAALCCEEGDAFQAERDALVADLLAARPGLQFLCIGGLRPAAPADSGVAGAPDEFVQEHWLDFERAPGVRSGGVGVLGVQFACETDGAVAPLRGLFPTVTIHGQASEVVVGRAPPPDIGFSASKFTATEGAGNQLTFEVTSANPVLVDVVVRYRVTGGTATAGSGSPADYRDLGTPPLEVTISKGGDKIDIDVDLFDDSVWEPDETLNLELVGLYDTGGNSLSASVAKIDNNRDTAVGEILEDEDEPYLFISHANPPCKVSENGPTVSFDVRLRDQTNSRDAPSAGTVTVAAYTVATGTGDGHATAGSDYTALTGNPVNFTSGDVVETVTVTILDDTSAPRGEPDETFKVELRNASGATLGSVDEVTCTIEDDEVVVSVVDVSEDEGTNIQFKLAFDRDFIADITVDYVLKDHATGTNKAARGTTCASGIDYREFPLTGTITIPHSWDHTKTYDLPQVVTTCADTLVEHDETFYLEISIPSGGGEAWVDPTDDGAVGTITNDDIPVISISPASGSGTEGQAATVDFTVKLDDGSGNALELEQDITVDYAVGGSGTSPAANPGQTGADYSVTLGGTALTGSTLSGTITFTAAAGAVVQQAVFAVAPLADYLAESNETLRIDLSNLSDPVSAAGFEDRDNNPLTNDSHADATIVEDPPPEFSVSDFTGKEGTEQVFTVTLANPRAGETATVAYTIGGGTATAPGTGVTLHDYMPKSGTPLACSATGPLTGTLSFSSGTTTQDVDVCLRRDAIIESDETVRLTLSSPTNSVIKDHDTLTAGLQAFVEGTIEDADPPEVFVDNVSATEGDPLTFTVALCDPFPGEDVTVDYSTASRSATAGLDFTAASGTLTFLDTDSADSQVSAQCGTGATESKSQTASVSTLNDIIAESDEEVHLVLSGQTPSHIALGKAVGVGQIVNRNPATVRVSDASAQEGDDLDFEITLEDGSGNPATITNSVTVYYVTADGTATEGADYTSVPADSNWARLCRRPYSRLVFCSSVTFWPADNPTLTNPDPAGRRHTVAVSTSTDTVVEGDETMALELQLDPRTDNAGLGDSQGIGTISDRSIYIRIDSPAGVDEGDTATFTVGLYDAGGALTSSSEQVRVGYATTDLTATAGSDYTAPAPGTLTFSPGDQQKTIDVATLTDSVAEPEETFRVDLSGPVNAILDKAVGIGTINANLDPELSVSDASVKDGGTMVFTVTLDAASASTVTVDYATNDGTATTADGDYTAVSDTLTFDAGDTTKTVDVVTIGDSDTSDETFQLVLSNPTNATIDDATGLGTILATTLPALSIADASGPEGSDMSFVVSLDQASSDEVSFVVDTSDGTATAPGDYEPVADTRYLIAAGSTQLDVNVEIKSDSDDEYVETFFVALSNPQNATIADGTAVGDIDGNLTCVDMRNSSTDPLPTASITGTSADEDDADGRMDLTITVTQAMCQDYDFRLAVSDDTRTGRTTATLGADYRQPSNVRLSRGQTSVGFSVPLIDDDVVEGDETFELEAGSSRLPGRRVLAAVTVYPTIVDDDEAELQLPSAGEARVGEGGWLGFVVRLDQPSVTAVTFDYATSDGSTPTATAGDDYVAATGTATIPAGDLSVTVTVRTVEDLLDELDENVDLTVSNVTGADPDPDGATATGVIVDDDDPPGVRVADAAAVDEGGKLSFAVTLDAPSGREVTVKRATRDGTAKAAAAGNDPGDNDYDALASADLVFAAGVTSHTVEVQTNTDSAYESTERMYLDLSSPDGATLADGIGVGDIRDATDRRVTVSDASVVEGGALSFVVSLVDGPASRELTVKYQTKADSAAAGTDYDNAYESAKHELKFLDGDQSLTVRVPTVQDKLDEDLETFDLTLSDPVGAVIIDGTASGVIIDDDPLPRLRVGDTTAAEADGSEEAKATFTVSLSEASGRDVTVAYSTADGLGTNAAEVVKDYVLAAGSLTIDAGDLSASVDVDLVNDDVAENVETFRLQALSAVNAVIDDSTGVATVTDDDGLIQILAEKPADVYEGDGASATFTVRLSRADSANPVTVSYATEDGTATVADGDYTAASGTLTFDAGDTSKTVSVALVNDDIAESSETFRLVLSSPSANASLGNDRATVLILDDDGLPTVSVADASAAEGSDVSFTVTLSRSSAREATVSYRTLDDPTAPADTAATAAVDYTAATGTATIAARSTTATVTVASKDDAFDEHNETFWLRLGSPTGATVLDGTAAGTITDDDPQPKLSIDDASADEGGTLTFDVRLDAVSGRTVTVPWATKDLSAGANSATAGSDYTAASGTVTIAATTTTASVTVASLADDTSEQDERFLVQLSTPVNAVLDDAAAVGRILDDDGLPRLSVADVSVDEDDGPAVFKVALSNASSQAVTVSYTTADGTATNPADYAPDLVRTLTIPASATEGEISVFIADDDLDEGDEDFTLTLSNPVNAVIADGAGTATATIVDDEGTPKLSVANARECEDGSTPADCQVRICRAEAPLGWHPWSNGAGCRSLLQSPTSCQPGKCHDNKMEFPVTLSHASTEDTSVRYTTFDGTATSPRDYIATSGTLTIPAGDTSAKIAVTLVDDGTYEDVLNRIFRLHLDNPDGVEIETVEAVGIINDDEPVPRLPATAYALVSHANEDDGFAEHTVRLTHPSDQTVTVNYSFQSANFCGLPYGHSDYYKHDPFDVNAVTPFIDVTPGELTFDPGVVEQTIRVPLADNSLTSTGTGWRCPKDYVNGTYGFKLTDHKNVYPLSRVHGGIFNSGSGTVWDDETSPYVESITAPDTLESAGNAVFTITLNRVLDENVVATFETVDGTAEVGDSDYTSTKTTVTFPPGTTTATVSVPIIDDSRTEGDETFLLRLVADSSDSNISHTATQLSGARAGTVTIVDDEGDPEVSVADVRANEDAGNMPFWVSLSRANASDVTVQYATADGTATAGADYTATSGTLTIDAGETGASLTVPIIDDTDDTEDDETFTLTLSNATGGVTIADASATATIVEDANLPVFTLRDASVTEGTGGTSYLFTRAYSDTCRPDSDNRCTGIDTAIQLDIRIVEVPDLGDEAATFGDDFAFCIGADLGCPAKIRQHSVNLEVGWFDSLGMRIDFIISTDDIIERDEKFQFEVLNVSGATFTDSQAWGTILNDDLPAVSVADVTVSEADAAVDFTLELHAPGVEPSSLDYTTVVRASAGDKAASPGEDYTSVSGTLSFAAGVTTATVSVPIIADTVDEFDETFLLRLSHPNGLVFKDPVAVGTITDDDDGWWIDDRSVWENAGPMVFTIERDHTSANAITVNYRFKSGVSAVGGASCADGVDFVFPSGAATGTVSMPAADKSVTLSVTLCDDAVLEGQENFVVELLGLPGRKTTSTGTIVDDDKDKPPLPARPTGLAAAAGDGSVTLSWSNPSNSTITRYEYQVNHNSTGTGNFTGWSAWTTVPGSGSSTTSHAFSGLTNGKQYRYKLRAVNITGTSPIAPSSAPWYVTATPTP